MFLNKKHWLTFKFKIYNSLQFFHCTSQLLGSRPLCFSLTHKQIFPDVERKKASRNRSVNTRREEMAVGGLKDVKGLCIRKTPTHSLLERCWTYYFVCSNKRLSKTTKHRSGWQCSHDMIILLCVLLSSYFR